MTERKRFDGVEIEYEIANEHEVVERIMSVDALLVRPQLEAALEEFEESVAMRSATSVASNSWYKAHDRVETAKADILYGLWLEVDE